VQVSEHLLGVHVQRPPAVAELAREAVEVELLHLGQAEPQGQLPLREAGDRAERAPEHQGDGEVQAAAPEDLVRPQLPEVLLALPAAPRLVKALHGDELETLADPGLGLSPSLRHAGDVDRLAAAAAQVDPTGVVRPEVD